MGQNIPTASSLSKEGGTKTSYAMLKESKVWKNCPYSFYLSTFFLMLVSMPLKNTTRNDCMCIVT